jgi:outer membrane protein assembly factor BamE (lipoprotein component of BamABCDE complex)
MNLGDSVPEWLVVGQTTRQEVLLVLGEPDGPAYNEEWYGYITVRRLGGIGFGGISDGGGFDVRLKVVRFRRLLVRFDAAGVVSEASFITARCGESSLNTSGGGDWTTKPCLDVAGNDVVGE